MHFKCLNKYSIAFIYLPKVGAIAPRNVTMASGCAFHKKINCTQETFLERAFDIKMLQLKVIERTLGTANIRVTSQMQNIL